MAGERPILIVDDDLSLRETLVEQLQIDGEFSADEAGTIGEAETKVTARDARFDAVILDVGLPDGDGRDSVRQPAPAGHAHADHHADRVRRRGRCGSRAWIRVPTTTSPSRSAWPSCWPGCAPSFRIFENSEDAVFTIGPYTRSARLPSCCRSR